MFCLRVTHEGVARRMRLAAGLCAHASVAAGFEAGAMQEVTGAAFRGGTLRAGLRCVAGPRSSDKLVVGLAVPWLVAREANP